MVNIAAIARDLTAGRSDRILLACFEYLGRYWSSMIIKTASSASGPCTYEAGGNSQRLETFFYSKLTLLSSRLRLWLAGNVDHAPKEQESDWYGLGLLSSEARAVWKKSVTR